jgi:hypothetical protein
MTSELTKAHAAFIKQVGTIEKDGDAQFGKHATLQGVLGVINAPLSNQGLSVHQVFDYTEDGKTVLRTILRHTSGEEIVSSALFPTTSGRNPLHDWGSNTTYMRRFCLLAILGIAPGIEDNDGDELTPPAFRKDPVISKPVVATPTQPQQDITISNPPLTKADRNELLDTLANLYQTEMPKFEKLQVAYRKQFSDCTDKMSDHIQEPKHRDFIFDFLS